MLDELVKRVEETDSYTLKIISDEEGYLDKECPSGKCLSKFKVFQEDWKEKFSDDSVYCPKCGNNAPASKWYTTEQFNQAGKQAFEYMLNEIGKAMEEDARRFNSRPQSGFLRMSMEVSPVNGFIDLPAKTLKKMEQKIVCDDCGARYAVIGASYYCPCCGKTSPKFMFIKTIKSVIKNVEVAEDKDDIIRNGFDQDTAELVCTKLLESSLSDLVTGFQLLCENIYLKKTNKKGERNAFQNLERGSKLWKESTGQGYNDWISDEDYTKINRCFQQRHIMEHKNGIIDAEYIEKSKDNSYKIGQRLVVSLIEILDYAKILEKLGNRIIEFLK